MDGDLKQGKFVTIPGDAFDLNNLSKFLLQALQIEKEGYRNRVIKLILPFQS